MTVRYLTFLLLFPVVCTAQQQQYYGSRVGDVVLSGSLSTSDLQLLPVRKGAVITPDNIRASIQILYDTHRYGYIEVTGEPSGDATRLIFRVRPNYFFSTFRIQPDNLLDRSLSGFLRLPYGERFSQMAVNRISEETEGLLQNDGYFDAKVTSDVSYDDSTRLATVVFNVSTKGRARVGTVKIIGGEETFPDRSKLYDAFGLKTDDEFLLDKLDSGIRKIREKFSNLPIGGFLNTRVDGQKDYKVATNTVDLNVTVQPGKFTLVEAVGYKISQNKLKELVPVYEEGTVDSDLVEEGRNKVRGYMQQEGYFDVQVQSEIINATLDNAVQINYQIDKGEQHRIVDVHFSGNVYFTDSELKARTKVRSAGMFDRGTFSPDLLETDRSTIQSMYRNAGFADAKVDANFEEKDHQLTIALSISEGDRLPIEIVDFEGSAKVATSELAERSNLHKGETYTPTSVEQARTALTSMYYAKGFPDATITQTSLRTGNTGYHVTFHITEGEHYTIGEVLVAGNELTAPKIVHRNANLYASTPYNPEAILDSQQRLYATGLFNRVDIVPLQQDLPGVRNVLIQVEDAKRILFAYGFGYQEFERLRATIELSHTNLFGLNRSITMRLSGSVRDQRIQATYREPRLFNRNLDGYASILYDRSDLPLFGNDQPLFKDTRIEGSLQVLKRYGTVKTLVLSSSYQKINLVDPRVNPHSEEFPDETGIVTISKIGSSYIHDRRNDLINPTSGGFATTSFQVATRALGGDVNFTSLYNQSIFYWPVNKAVIATSLRMGWIQPYGVTKQAPITERYFAGGSTTLRGYSLDEAGPQGGGDAETIANFEYRFPMNWVPIKNVGGTFFYDTGNVFPTISEVSLTNFSHSAGAGIRYNTPLGPVRFDVGFNLHQAPIDSTVQKRVHYFFTLGHTF